VRSDRVFVLFVDFDTEELLDLLGGPHFDGIPCHALTDMDTDLATDTFVEPNLHVRDYDVHAVGRVAGSVLDTIDRTEAHARLTAGAVIRDDHGKFLWLLLLARNLGWSFRNDQGWICFF